MDEVFRSFRNVEIFVFVCFLGNVGRIRMVIIKWSESEGSDRIGER